MNGEQRPYNARGGLPNITWAFQRVISIALTLLLVLGFAGCAHIPPQPQSLGEQHSSYSYIPLDPLAVIVDRNINCGEKPVLDSLPDQAVRIAVGQYDASGNLVFGPNKIGVEGKSYMIILDYISVDTTHLPVIIERTKIDDLGKKIDVSVFDDTIEGRTQFRVVKDPELDSLLKSARIEAIYSKELKESLQATKQIGEKVIIPVYVGVGLRLTASVTVTKGTANLSSLGSIAASAEAGHLSGSLIVQTLGVTGKSVSTSLPLPSELNQTTIQNAILALGSIKAVLYDKGNTLITPRVVGIYNPIGGGQQMVNGIISVLSKDPIVWEERCAK